MILCVCVSLQLTTKQLDREADEGAACWDVDHML